MLDGAKTFAVGDGDIHVRDIMLQIDRSFFARMGDVPEGGDCGRILAAGQRVLQSAGKAAIGRSFGTFNGPLRQAFAQSHRASRR